MAGNSSGRLYSQYKVHISNPGRTEGTLAGEGKKESVLSWGLPWNLGLWPTPSLATLGWSTKGNVVVYSSGKDDCHQEKRITGGGTRL